MIIPHRFLKSVLALAVFSLSVPLLAQTRGTLRGRVQDQSGAVVPGVTIIVKNSDTGEQHTVVTDMQGNYAFTSIPLGRYVLTAELAGFKKVEVQGITIEVGIPAEANVTMQVGAPTEETVTVTDKVQTEVNTITATLTNVISTRQVADLPLPTRNPVDLARLQIGIAVTGDNTRTASVGGLRGSATNVTQDGVNAMDNFVKTDSFFALTAPSLYSTEEFSVTVGTVGSDAGRGVAQVRMVTKSGTNDLHGSVFWQHRNDNLNANSFLNNTSGTPKPRELQNWYGWGVGGPVYLPKVYDGRNRSFWFFSYEAFRENFAATRNRTVLTDQARKGIFRYIGADGAQQSVDLTTIGNFPTLNPLTTATINKMPLPDNTEVGDGLNTAGWRYNVTGTDPSDKYVGRFDQQLLQSSKYGYHKLEFVYNKADFLLTPDTFNGLEAPFPGGIDAEQFSARTLMAVAIHSAFGPHLTNEARFGHQRAPVGFQRVAPPAQPFLTYYTSVTNYDNTFMSQGRNTLLYQFLDNFAIVRGRHTIRAGMDFMSLSAISFNDAGIWPRVDLGTNSANPDGILNSMFPNLPAGATGTSIANRARNVYADLMGINGNARQTFNVTSPTSGFVPGASNSRVYRQRLLSLYVQDEWRARRNLTLNYGLRWEWQGVPYERHGLTIQPVNQVAGLFGISGTNNLFNPASLKGSAPQPIDFFNQENGKKLYNNDFNNFAPFIGLAYQPKFSSGPLHWIFGDQSSIRAGFSISYLQDGWTVVTNAVANPGLNQTSQNNTPTGVLTSAGVPVPAPVFKMPITDADNLAVSSSNGMVTFDPSLRTPYVQQWSFGIERELARGWVLEARYVGNHAVKVFRGVDFNEVNIFENGFLAEFNNAKKNLDINGGKSFAPGAPGTVALPIFSTLFSGLAASSGFANSTFINQLNLGNIGAMANTLAFQTTYKANRANLTFNGQPAPNFFVVNPNAAFARALSNYSFSNYNSLQVELRKRMSYGLYAQAGYTFSKALTDSDQGGQSTREEPRTLRNMKLDKHRASFDQTHRFISNFIFELPFGTGRRWLNSSVTPVRKIVEGWQIGSIINWQTGGPMFINSARSTLNNFNTGLNPSVFLGNTTFQQIRDAMGVYKTSSGVFFMDPQYLKITTNAAGRATDVALKEGLLGAPPAGSLGTFPRNSINSPSFFQLDFNVIKRVYIAERTNFELRVNFLNALNHPNFTIGNLTFDSGNFSRVSSTRGNPRIINFILAVNF